MSCVIGLVTDGRVLMVADSSVCDGNVIVANGFPKIVKLTVPTCPTKHIAIGMVGAPLPAQVITSFFVPPEHPLTQSSEKYIIQSVVPEIRRLLIEYDAYGQDQRDHTSGLIAYDYTLYYIDGNMSVIKSVTGYEAVGSGREVALGSLYTTGRLVDSLDPDERILGALDAASALTAYVEGPYQMVEVKR